MLERERNVSKAVERINIILQQLIKHRVRFELEYQ